MIVVGILLEVLAAALGTTSKQLIAYSEHTQKRCFFRLGASINIFIGPTVDAFAYAFAPQVVIAPLASLDVIFNALTAPYTLYWQKEDLTRVHITGTGLVVLGAVCTALCGSVSENVLDVESLEAQLLRPASLAYMLLELASILAINVCLKAHLLNSTVRGIFLGVVAGVLMGNVFFIKGFIGLVRRTITNHEVHAWLRPTPYILLCSAAAGAVLGHVYMRKGLGEYKGIFFVSIFEGAHITAACLSGIIVMSEMAHAPWWRYVFYWLSVAVILLGMVVFQRSKESYEMDKTLHSVPVMKSGRDPLLDACVSESSSDCGACYERLDEASMSSTPPPPFLNKLSPKSMEGRDEDACSSVRAACPWPSEEETPSFGRPPIPRPAQHAVFLQASGRPTCEPSERRLAHPFLEAISAGDAKCENPDLVSLENSGRDIFCGDNGILISA